jgi:tRNA-2-methylthio-N6-dimethylallyladenosine synthase
MPEKENIDSAKKIFVKTYGCQMNVYDSMKIQDVMAPHGYIPTQDFRGS